jgi:hypothetical protein
MAINPDDWLVVEQQMEEENYVMLQTKTEDSKTEQQPQLLVISSNAAQGISSPATFSVIVSLGGRKGTDSP